MRGICESEKKHGINKTVSKGCEKMELHTILGDIRKADQDYHLIDDGDRIAVGGERREGQHGAVDCAAHVFKICRQEFRGGRHSYKARLSEHGLQ